MPGGDGTGPAGMGPMTGRAAGYCAGYPVPGFMNPIPRRGFWGGGRGGGGRGRRNWFYATGMPGWARAGYGYPAFGGAAPYSMPDDAYGVPYAAPGYSAYGAPYAAQGYPGYGPAAPYGAPMTKEQELEGLKGEAESLQDALDGIKKRIEELEPES